MLVASATTLPLLLTASGCRSSDAFDGPDPLAGRPSPGHDVVVLQAAISAEQALISLYVTATATVAAGSASAAGSELLDSLLAQHRQHLARLRAALVLPPGASPGATASPGTAVSPGATASAGGGAGGQGAGGQGAGRGVVARLRTAERASAAAGLRRLATVDPALAQLFASIAACDATHVAALAALA
jgi:hypothetical protein